MELKLDLHIHSRRSPDGCMSLEEIVDRARKAGLNGAAVCDHDRCLEEVPAFPDFLLIPGIEVSTECGHLLGLFVRKPVETRIFREAAEAIRRQGGLAVLAHPFQRSRDPGRIAPAVPLLDGVEVWNSRASRNIPEANRLAADFARTYGLRPFAGSDAHRPQEVGNASLTLQAEALTLEAAKAALLSGRVRIEGRRSPARYTAGSQFVKRKKTGAAPPAYFKWAAFAAKCCLQDVFFSLRKGENHVAHCETWEEGKTGR